jgi:hypothetical protein
MKKINYGKIFIAVLFILFFIFPHQTQAVANFKDTINISWPGSPADHTINFLNVVAIPPGGKIVLVPAAGEFEIFSGFDFTDVDLATSSAQNGVYDNRTLAAVASAVADGVAVMASSSNDSITITLNSTYGIDIGVYILIKLGTVANYDVNGDQQIINPSSPGSYNLDVRLYDQGNNLINRGNLKVAILEPVTTHITIGKLRFDGTPSGVLAYGTTQTIMSLMTNYIANCRFATASDTPYIAMTSEFSYTGNFYHSIILIGLTNGQSYHYFVRCRDAFNIDDDTDFKIDFFVSGLEGSTGDETSVPGPGGGGGGGGSGGGGGGGVGRNTGPLLPFPPPPGTPSITFQGWAYPSSQIVLLKDNKQEKQISAAANSSFKFDLYELKQGVYTFGIWAEDKYKRRSITQSFTIYLKEGTMTQVYQIFLPPTIELKKRSVVVGENVEVLGQSLPGATVEAWLYPRKNETVKDSEIIKVSTTVGSSGDWSAAINTSGLAKGQYKVKARAYTKVLGNSEFSQALDVSIGTSVGVSACAGADLNHDGRVNIFDFSILLFYWGTNNNCADQNSDGIVDLIDFSIMMYYWTG